MWSVDLGVFVFVILNLEEYVGQSDFEQRANAVVDGEIVDI